MQLSIATILLAATSAIAAPSVGKRESNFIIKDLKARTSLSNTMSFTLLDNANPEGDAAMKCNLIWPSQSAPDQDAACGPNSEYLIQFPDGFPGIGHFTLAVERTGENPIGGRAYLDESDGKWNCVKDPEINVKKDCKYDGSYTIPI